MIKSIYLENWKTHLKSQFEFAKGTNVIVGISGAGKTSITDAISYALYGTFPSLAARKVSLEETIMSKPLKQQTTTIRLEFDYSNKSYQIERTSRRNGMSEATLREGTKIIAGPKTTDVTKKVTEILEVNYDLFSRAIYSEQNQIDFFLKLSASQRKEKIDELLGLDRYERVRTNAVTLLNRMKKINDDKKAFLQEQRKKINPVQISEYEWKLKQKREEIAQKEKEMENVQKLFLQKELAAKEIEKKEKEHKSIRELEISKKSKLESLQAQIENAQKKSQGHDLTSTQEVLLKMATELEKLHLAKKSLEDLAKAAQREENGIGEKLAVQKNLLLSNAKRMKEAKDLEGKCPICCRPLSEHDKKKLDEEIKGEEESISRQSIILQKELEQQSKKSKEIISQIEKNTRQCEELREKIQTLTRLLEIAQEIKDKKFQKEKLEEELAKIHSSLLEMKFDEKDAIKSREQYYEAREKHSKIKIEINATKELIAELETAERRIKEMQSQIEELEAQTKISEKNMEKLSMFTSALKSTQAELRNVMIDTINQAMEQLWPKIYPYQDILCVKLTVDEGSYEIMVRQVSGEWIRVEGILSGGERSSAALTLRIAISLVLTQNLGWIILDEPTHNLDVNSVKELSEMMRNHLPQFIEQIFIITHEKELEYAASGKLYTLEREKERDGVTKISIE
ncbi:MAG TPA: AAA family ATPase [archaeon]|nr:AAA family ATPase [archaeon]